MYQQALSSISLFQEFLSKSDANKSGDLNRQEFFDYLRQHERQLRLVFTSIDENKDGKSHNLTLLVLPRQFQLIVLIFPF